MAGSLLCEASSCTLTVLIMELPAGSHAKGSLGLFIFMLSQ